MGSGECNQAASPARAPPRPRRVLASARPVRLETRKRSVSNRNRRGEGRLEDDIAVLRPTQGKRLTPRARAASAAMLFRRDLERRDDVLRRGR